MEFSFLKSILVLILYMCLCLSVGTWSTDVHEVRKREGFRSLELEFQVDVNSDSLQEQFMLLLMSYLSSSWSSTF